MELAPIRMLKSSHGHASSAKADMCVPQLHTVLVGGDACRVTVESSGTNDQLTVSGVTGA